MMTHVYDFVVDLAHAGKTCKQIISIVSAAYPIECLSQSQIYNLIKQMKEGKNVEDKRGRACTLFVRDSDFIEAVHTDVEADHHIMVAQLAEKYDVAGDTIHKVLVDDLGLSKKSARWVPKILSEEQMAKRKKCSEVFLHQYHEEGKQFLERIVTMDESAVCYHTPETKNQSKQWVPRGTLGPIKGRSVASRKKVMVLVFFDCSGLIYTNVVPNGKTVNAEYIISALRMFFSRFGQKRPKKDRRMLTFSVFIK